MSPLHPTLFLSTVVAFLIPSCNPKVNRFDVFPDRLCGSDTAQVSYDVSGSPTLVKRRSGDGDPDSIVYVLFAERHGETDSTKHLVLHWPSSPEKDMDFDTQRLGKDSLIAFDTIDVRSFGNGVIVKTVVSRSVRPILLSHAGIAAVVQTNGSSDAFRALLPSGIWEARAALLPGERMGEPATLRLHTHLILSCSQ